MGCAQPGPTRQSTSGSLIGPGGPASRMSGGDYRYWLRFQIGLTAGGILVWLVGIGIDNSFLSGVGTGVMVSALAIRFLRGRRPGEVSDGDGA